MVSLCDVRRIPGRIRLEFLSPSIAFYRPLWLATAFYGHLLLSMATAIYRLLSLLTPGVLQRPWIQREG
ncbi:MAG: hypothetical protein KDK25_10255, partial [Leptospiraceae bacterium]|nr:hypothetical protein [Leptospiraceae bacterium]